MKKNQFNSLLVSLLLSLTVNAFAQVQDNVIDDAGDIAIVAYYAPGGIQGGFSFVFLDNCPAGTVIRFEDEEWSGTAYVSDTGEGEITWTNTGGTIPRGTVVHLQSTSGVNAFNSISCNYGSAIETDAGFGTTDTDQLYAMTGTRAATGTFLTFFGDLNNAGSPSTLNGTGLTAGVNAINAAMGGYYSGSTMCNSTSVACATMLNTVANWTLVSGATGFTYPTNAKSFFNGSVLPLEWVAFTARTEGVTNVLRWQTALEIGVGHFDIERSVDGQFFTKIGEAKAKGSNATYEYLDALMPPLEVGRLYYRLKINDLDGKADYSKIIALSNQHKTKVKVFPSVTSGELMVEASETGAGIARDEANTFQMFNLFGQQVLKGRTGQRLDVSNLPNGTYVVKVGQEQAKFVKQ